MKKFDNRTFVLFNVLLLVCVAAFTYYFVPSGQITDPTASFEIEKDDGSKEIVSRSRTNNKGQSTSRTGKKKVDVVIAKESFQKIKRPLKVMAGWVTITDLWGGEVNKFRAGLTGNGWLALPASACLGGNVWNFKSDSGWTSTISGGLWVKGDKVGLWHLANAPGSIDGQGFAKWNESEPVSWRSIESVNQQKLTELYPGLTDGFFVSTSLPGNIDETGVFIQNGSIVGWSFSKWPGKGFMWPGNEGDALQYRTWVKYFYDITFANGREEKFIRALSMKQRHTGSTRLASFIEGFRSQPKLILRDTPDHLLPEEIIKHMRVILINAIDIDERIKVADMLTGQMLKQIGDIGLFIDLVPIIAAVNGSEAAIDSIEDTGAYIVRQLGREVPALDSLHRNFYQDWLRSLLSDKEVDEGAEVYNEARSYYPDDAEIHLLGVELKLLSGNWEEAERLLYMRNYPAAFQTRFELLANRVSDMKGEDEKIVIRFTRGSDRIMVTAVINELTFQEFLVDTGATTVTIPSSTADALGLDIVYGEHMISTVGGPVKASKVIIDAIEINGWVEYGVRAFVVDIPGRPGLGLLGLSYLGRFQMDLNPEEGILLLSPR